MALKVTADPSTRIIEVTDIPVGGLQRLDVVSEIFSRLKDDWHSTPALQRLRFPFRTFGDPVGAGEQIGPYVFFDNISGWRILPYDVNHQLVLENGNLVAESDVEGLSFGLINSRAGRTIQVRDQTSAQGLLLGNTEVLNAIEQQGFVDGAVWVDASNGSSGTAFPLGTATDPVDNMADARTIAGARNLRVFQIVTAQSITTLDQSYQNFVFINSAMNTADWPFVNMNGQNVQLSKFQGLHFLGTSVGAAYYSDCTINVGTYDGTFTRCAIINAFSFESGSNDRDTSFIDCSWRLSAALNYAGVTDTENSIYGGSGALLIRNMTSAGITLNIDGFNGTVTIENTCTAGTITIRGGVTVIDNSAGVTLNDESDRTFFFRKVLTIAKWLGLR